MLETLIFSKKNQILNNKKKIIIGEWLVVGKKDNYKNYKIINYNQNKIDKLKDFNYVKTIYKRVLKNLTPILNELNHKKFREKDWEILLFYFLSNYIFFAYDKWKLIKKLKKNFSFIPVQVFSYRRNYFLQESSLYFYNQLKTDHWDDWLYSQIIKALKFRYIEKKIKIKGSKVLVMGLTFKENCTDIRNSGIESVIKKLKKLNFNLDLYDPWADNDEVKKTYNIYPSLNLVKNTYDGVIIAVAHKKFKSMGLKFISKLCKKKHVIYDLKYLFSKSQVDLRL